MAPTISLQGIVRSAKGAPEAGALVAILPTEEAVAKAITESATDGTFSFSVPPGNYTITATSATHPAATLVGMEWKADSAVELAFGTGGDLHHGRVFDAAGTPWSHQRVRIERVGAGGGVFYCDTDDNGEFRVKLPRAVGHRFNLEIEGQLPVFVDVEGQPTQPLRLALPSVASEEVIAWIRDHALPLTSVEPGSGFDDLRPLKGSIADAHIVALGEATHGSREIAQMRHRLLEYLVTELGFTVLAVEMGFVQALVVNDYVLGGERSPQFDALLKQSRTSEANLATMKWMRAYNADPAHKRKLQYIGVDFQNTFLPAFKLAEYFDAVDPVFAERARLLTSLFRERPSVKAYQAASAQQRKESHAGLTELATRLDQKKSEYIRASDQRTWLHTRHMVTSLQQAEELRAFPQIASTAAFNQRDLAMAENTKWILDTQPPGTRMVYWAHNGHVSHGETSRRPQGLHLRSMFKGHYLNVATAFFEGSIRAHALEKGRSTGLVEHTLGPAPPGTVASTLSRGGHANLFLDLRQRPASGPVAEWFAQPHPIRSISARFLSEKLIYEQIVLPNSWDALIYIEKSSGRRQASHQ